MSVVEGDSGKRKPRPRRKKKRPQEPRSGNGSSARAGAALKAENQAAKEAIDLLLDASALVLAENCIQIAQGMADLAAQGHVPPAKFLCDLAQKKKQLAAAKEQNKKRSIAAQWSTEPEWTSEPNGPP